MTGMKKSRRLTPEQKEAEKQRRSQEKDLSMDDLEKVSGGARATKKKTKKKATRKKIL